MSEKQNFLQRMINKAKDKFSETIKYDPNPKPLGPEQPKQVGPKYPELPPSIPQEYKQLFISEASKAGLSPEEFGTTARREQGPNTQAGDIALVGGMDPNDRGLMQINKINEPLVKDRFMKELGVAYDPSNSEHSIIGSRMVYEENRKQFEQMMMNRTTDSYNNTDLINAYNLGPTGVLQEKLGDPEKQKRLQRYIKAGTNY